MESEKEEKNLIVNDFSEVQSVRDSSAEESGRLTKKELRQIYLRYQFMCESAMSYEKMHGAAWAYSYLPLADKYYEDDPEAKRRLLMRHSLFYNTEPQTGQLVNGIVASIEEEIGLGKDIDENLSVSIKASLMGPLAGIGDSIIQGILIPTLLSIAMGLSIGGNPMGPIFYILSYGAIAGGITYVAFKSGYRLGVSAIDKVIGEGAKRITDMFNTLGIIVVGGLSATTVFLSTPLNIPQGEEMAPLQDLMDASFPGLLPLIMVLLSWWMISVKKLSPTKVILILTSIISVGVIIGVF